MSKKRCWPLLCLFLHSSTLPLPCLCLLSALTPAGQRLKDLANDLRFFKDMGANMIGMGPYITEQGTPVADMWQAQFGHVDKKKHMKDMFELTTR